VSKIGMVCLDLTRRSQKIPVNAGFAKKCPQKASQKPMAIKCKHFSN